jgi:hypothetical protein
MSRTLSTKDLARQLGVSEQTIRYHARKGAFPYDPTPGGHRRYDLDEVRAALRRVGAEPAVRAAGSFPERGARLDLATPSGELTPTMRVELQATAAYDEGRLEEDSERLGLPDFMDAFAVPGSARYPQQSRAVGAGA